jgi:serine/threonine-protein kinase
MSSTGVARLVDFGLAHRSRAEMDAHHRDGAKTIIGTRGYMAPEQVLHPDRVTFRADIYALGATLYEAAMGVPLRPRDKYGESGKNSVLRDTTEAIRRSPPSLRRLLGWMLATKPEGRPSSYRALIAELEATLRQSPDGRAE